MLIDFADEEMDVEFCELSENDETSIQINSNESDNNKPTNYSTWQR